MVTTLLGPNGQPLSLNGTNPVGRPSKGTKIDLVPGLSMWGGTISEEYLPDLKPFAKAFKVFQEMEDDAVIGTLYESIRAPLLDAKFSIEAASDKPADVEAANFIRLNTTESLIFDWEEHIEDMLDYMSYGFSIGEKILTKRPDGFYWLEDIVPIGQETLWKWGDTDKRGRVTSFIQNVFDQTSRTWKQNAAPMDKLLHFTFRSRKRNPQGRSLSRSLYRPWYFKKNLEVVEAIGAERDVGNVPVAQLGEGYYEDEDITKLKTAMAGLRMDETAYMIVPFGSEVKPFGRGGKVYNIREIIRDYQHLIRQRFFMDFVSLGSEGVGTQALAKEVTGFFSLALGATQNQMIKVWQRQLIPYLLMWNRDKFANITGMPKIKWAKPGKLNVQAASQSLVQLTSGGIVHADKGLEDHMREMFELPPISEEEIRDLEEIEQEKVRQEQAVSVKPNPGEGSQTSAVGSGSAKDA